MSDLLQRLKTVSTLPKLDAMREEVARAMMGQELETFSTIQTAFIRAKNRLRRVPVKDRGDW